MSQLYCILTITLLHISVDLLYYIRLRVYWGITLQQPVIEPYLISPSVRWSGFSEHSSFPCKIQNTHEHQSHLHTLETSEPSFPNETCLPHTVSWSLPHKSLLPSAWISWFPCKHILMRPLPRTIGRQTCTVLARPASHYGYCAAIWSLLDEAWNKTLIIYRKKKNTYIYLSIYIIIFC